MARFVWAGFVLKVLSLTQILDLSHTSLLCMSLACSEIKIEIRISFSSFIRSSVLPQQNVQLLLCVLSEAENFFERSSFIYLYLSTYFSMFVYLSTYFSMFVYLSTYFSMFVYLSTYFSMFVYLSTYFSMFVYLSTYFSMFVYLSTYFSMFVYLSTYFSMFVYLSTYFSMFVYLSTYFSMFVYLSTYFSMFVYLSTYFSMFVYLSTYFSMFVYLSTYFSMFVYLSTYFSMFVYFDLKKIYHFVNPNWFRSKAIITNGAYSLSPSTKISTKCPSFIHGINVLTLGNSSSYNHLLLKVAPVGIDNII